jgi:hypothetical protein
MRARRPVDAAMVESIVLKVFKEGWSLEDLQKQWPPCILLKGGTLANVHYQCGEGFRIRSGLMLNDGRFAFLLPRCWG